MSFRKSFFKRNTKKEKPYKEVFHLQVSRKFMVALHTCQAADRCSMASGLLLVPVNYLHCHHQPRRAAALPHDAHFFSLRGNSKMDKRLVAWFLLAGTPVFSPVAGIFLLLPFFASFFFGVSFRANGGDSRSPLGGVLGRMRGWS